MISIERRMKAMKHAEALKQALQRIAQLEDEVEYFHRTEKTRVVFLTYTEGAVSDANLSLIEHTLKNAGRKLARVPVHKSYDLTRVNVREF